MQKYYVSSVKEGYEEADAYYNPNGIIDNNPYVEINEANPNHLNKETFIIEIENGLVPFVY